MPKVFTSKPGYVGIMVIDGAVPGSIQLRGTQYQGMPQTATIEENFRGVLTPMATVNGRRIITWDSREVYDKYKKVNARVIPARRVIFTGIEYEQASHVQFQQTLLRSIYMYSFGERMGHMTISGLGLSSSCYYSFANSSILGYRTVRDNRSGVEDILKSYNTHRVSFDHEMLKITIGGETIRGFLTGCQVRSATPENMTYNWAFTLATLPRDLY